MTEATTKNDNDNARRWVIDTTQVGIAFGATALILVGVILILALPRPLGEVLTLAGVSIWTTQIEAPKRVIESAKDTMKSEQDLEIIDEVAEDKEKETTEDKTEEVAPTPVADIVVDFSTTPFDEQEEKISSVVMMPQESTRTAVTLASTFDQDEDDSKIEYFIQPDAKKPAQRKSLSERFGLKKLKGKSSKLRSARSVSGAESVNSKQEKASKRPIFRRRLSDSKMIEIQEQPKMEAVARKWASFKNTSKDKVHVP